MKVEKGYLVCWLELALLVITILVAFVFQKVNMDRAYAIALMNSESLANGSYGAVTYVVDMNVFSWVCTALSGALGVSVAAQFRKKRINNNWQYMEECMDGWLKDEAIRPYAVQLMQAFLQTNTSQ